MAQHIDNVEKSSIRKVSRAEFLKSCRTGDNVYCWGKELVSLGIEDFTGGPSHVLKIWQPDFLKPLGSFLTFEATIELLGGSGGNVHYGRFEDYLNGYDGDLVLCRRSILTPAQIQRQMQNTVPLIGQRYNSVEFVSLVARRFMPWLPLVQPKRELFCSAAIQAVSEDTVPYQAPAISWNTPEDDYTDPTEEPVCALLKGTK